MGMWGEEWKGVKLARLYMLLREQFAHPEDPWFAETLEWWNEFRLTPLSTVRVLTAFAGKYLAVPPGPLGTLRNRCGIRRVPRFESAWRWSGERGCDRPLETSVVISEAPQYFL